MCERQRSKELKWYTDESNVLLDVPVMIPEHADDLSELRETEDTAGIELNGCLSNTGVRACIDEVLAGRQDRRLPERSKFVANKSVKENSDWRVQIVCFGARNRRWAMMKPWISNKCTEQLGARPVEGPRGKLNCNRTDDVGHGDGVGTTVVWLQMQVDGLRNRSDACKNDNLQSPLPYARVIAASASVI